MTEDKRKSLFMKPNSDDNGIRFFFLEDAESGRETLGKASTESWTAALFPTSNKVFQTPKKNAKREFDLRQALLFFDKADFMW